MLQELRNTQSATPDDTIEIVSRLLKRLDTPLAKQLRLALRGDHSLVLSLGYNPSSITTPDLAKRNWLAANLAKKALWLKIRTDEERRAACLDGWREDERLNAITNSRLRTRCSSTDVSGDSFIHEMSRKIARVLGPLSLDRVFKEVGFSSGSSTRLPRRQGQPHNKIGGKPHVTPMALPYAVALARSSPAWTSYCVDYRGWNVRDWFEVVPGGRWFTVPKSAKTFRSCEQQPDMNLILQKGVGSFIRTALKRVGVDLDLGQSYNGRLALEASVSNALSTLDLASASNSVTRELVRRLLPPDWFDLLDALRCEWVEVDGVWTRLEMFSSMGNGFTFELESLIFWAAAATVCDDLHSSVGDTRIAIFGDDIIVPKAAAGRLVELLEFLGFRVNTEKSFFEGPFRESCGVHAYLGVDITPFYVEESFALTNERLRVANKLRAWSAVDGVCDPRYYRVWRDLAEPLARFAGPSSAGDAHLHVPMFRRRTKAWVRRDEGGVSTLPDRQESGLVAWLLQRQALAASEDLQRFAGRLVRVGNWRAVIPPLQPRLSVRQQGDRITVKRQDFCSEAVPGVYSSVKRFYDSGRDVTIAVWPVGSGA